MELRTRGWHQRVASPRPSGAACRPSPAGSHARGSRRSRGPLRLPVTGPPALTFARAKTPDPGRPLARRGGVRLSRSGLDPRPHHSGHRGGVGCPLPQEPRRQTPPRHCAGRLRCRYDGPPNVAIRLPCFSIMKCDMCLCFGRARIGGVARTVPLRRRTPPAKASARPGLLHAGWPAPGRNLNLFMRRSVTGMDALAFGGRLSVDVK